MDRPRRPRARLACLVILPCVLAGPVRADHPPKFRDPEVTARIQQLSDILDGLLAAAKAKDAAKIKEWTGKFLATARNDPALAAKISPEENERAAKWGEEQMKKLSDAGWTPDP